MKVYRVNIGPKLDTGIVYQIRPGDDRFTGRAVVTLPPTPCPHCSGALDVRELALIAGQAAFDAGASEISEETPPERYTEEMMRLRAVRQDIDRAEKARERESAESARAIENARAAAAVEAQRLDAIVAEKRGELAAVEAEARQTTERLASAKAELAATEKGTADRLVERDAAVKAKVDELEASKQELNDIEAKAREGLAELRSLERAKVEASKPPELTLPPGTVLLGKEEGNERE